MGSVGLGELRYGDFWGLTGLLSRNLNEATIKKKPYSSVGYQGTLEGGHRVPLVV